MRIFITLIVLLISTSASADFANSRRIDTTDIRAVGGVSMASSSPAATALNDKFFSFSALSIDVRGSLSEGLATYDWIQNVIDFKDSLDSVFNVLKHRDELVVLASNVPSILDLQIRMDIVRIEVGNKHIGKFLFGAYAEGFAGVRLALPSVDQIKVVGNEINIGEDITMVAVAGQGDIGGRIGYGRVFNLPRRMEISGGVLVRVFQRWIIPTYRINVDKKISGMDNIHIPDFSYETGIGGAVDLSSIFALNDRFLDAHIGMEINSIGATHYNEITEREIMDFAFGAMIKPLRSINIKWWEVGTELHAYEDGRPSWHIGTACNWGGRWLNFSPRIGGIVGDRGTFGETRNIFTAGFSTMLGIIQLAGVFELYSGGYDAGVRLAFGN